MFDNKINDNYIFNKMDYPLYVCCIFMRHYQFIFMFNSQYGIHIMVFLFLLNNIIYTIYP